MYRSLMPLLIVLLPGCANTESFVAADAAPDSWAPQERADMPRAPDYRRPEAGYAGCQAQIDLVFVLDLSSSMNAVLGTLEREIDRVVDAANKLQAGAQFGLVTFVDNVKLDETGPLEAGRVHTEASSLGTAFAHYQAVYTAHNRNPGDGPNGPTTQNPICEENALDALYEAASAYPWRAGSTRVIIVATDDTFLEAPDNYGDRDGDGKTDKQDFPREGDYPAHRTVRETVAELRRQKVRVFSFTRLQAPGILDPLRCGTGRRLPWGAVAAGWSLPYRNEAPIPAQTDGKNFDLVEVAFGQKSLTETINNVVVESHCNPIK